MAHSLSSELTRVRRLVLEYGRNTTCYQLLTPGMQYWFDPGGEGVVGYVKRASTRVVAGVPICAEARLAACWEQFAEQTVRLGLRLCAVGVEEPFASLVQHTEGYTVVRVGAQPVWDPAHWSALIDEHSSIRSQVNRAQNKGVRVVERKPPFETQPLRRCWQRWLSHQPLPPLHFLTEPELFDELLDRRLFVATREDEVLGFIVLSPVPQRKGWLTELSVRDPDAPNGTMSLLVDGVMRTVAAEGSTFVSLGLVPLTERGHDLDAPLPLWAQGLRRAVLHFGSRFYNVEGLEAFKAKFHPDRWEASYLISRESRLSPWTLYAATAAFTGGSPLRFTLQTLHRALI